MDLRLFLLLYVFLFKLVTAVQLHGRTLNTLALRLANHRRFHVHDLTVDVLEDRRSHLDDTLHERGLNQLEVELPLRVVREDCAVVGEVQLEIVLDAERLREDGLGHERAHVVVVGSMLPKGARATMLGQLVRYLELQDKLLRLTRPAKEKALFADVAIGGELSPVLVDFDLCFV